MGAVAGLNMRAFQCLILMGAAIMYMSHAAETTAEDSWEEADGPVQALMDTSFDQDCASARSACLDRAKQSAGKSQKLLDVDPRALSLIVEYFNGNSGTSRRLLGADHSN